ncbi:hypothetical protein KSF_085190 [Reticulibacter mediterranei]|uniref:Uncharacterized protein n=1 Tax=Reticulibacter mediterranei TaxID=2778369 RepID=A0A8J3IPQ1_9CHLR|nr:hypothetical protein KSF_085190 [Reticulibacter mediterranei]
MPPIAMTPSYPNWRIPGNNMSKIPNNKAIDPRIWKKDAMSLLKACRDKAVFLYPFSFIDLNFRRQNRDNDNFPF